MNGTRRDSVYYGRYYTPKPQIAKVCDVCGEGFSTAHQDGRFCSDICARKWHRQHDPSRKVAGAWTDRRRANYQKRRALKKAATVGDPVLLSEISERDGNRCGLCGERVNGEPYPHPLSASLDHMGSAQPGRRA